MFLDESLRLVLQMEPQLFVQFGFLPSAEDQGTAPLTPGGDPSHVVPPVESSTQFTAATERSHCERSRVNSRFPAGVGT